MPDNPRPLPAPLATALARAAAEGKCEARVPMEDAPGAEFRFDGFKGKGARFSTAFSDPGIKGRRRFGTVPPLTPGGPVRVWCPFCAGHGLLIPDDAERCACYGEHDCGVCGNLGVVGCQDCEKCDSRGCFDLRILSVTPERERCETCDGRLSVPCEGPEPGERPVETCPTCRGDAPGWVDWRVRLEVVE